MLHRTVCLASLFIVTALFARAQVKNTQNSESCKGRKCAKFAASDRGPDFPANSSLSNVDPLSYKQGDGPVSCAVVKYDVSGQSPVLHLLCPEPQVYAPLRVHLALSWTEPGEIPQIIKNMAVDPNSLALFRSVPGNTRAELWMHSVQDAQSRKEWVKFTTCKVSLVLPPER
jgi:hypothetical protein